MITDKVIATHYNWGNECDSWILAAEPGLPIKQEKIPPGAREQLHYHNTATQFFFVLEGEAGFMVDGVELTINERQGILIKPGKQHYIANNTDKDLEFLVISQPSTDNDRVNV